MLFTLYKVDLLHDTTVMIHCGFQQQCITYLNQTDLFFYLARVHLSKSIFKITCYYYIKSCRCLILSNNKSFRRNQSLTVTQFSKPPKLLWSVPILIPKKHTQNIYETFMSCFPLCLSFLVIIMTLKTKSVCFHAINVPSLRETYFL